MNSLGRRQQTRLWTKRSEIVLAAFVLSSVLVVGLWSASSSARRLPSPGHKATLALPLNLVAKTRVAHLYAPIIELPFLSTPAANLARPPLPDAAPFRSVVLSSIVSDDDDKVWTLSPRENPRQLQMAVTRCLSPTPSRIEHDWPALALRAAKITAVVEVVERDVVITLSRPVGPMLELLSGCPLRDDGGAPTGAFFPTVPGILTSRAQAPLGPTPLGILEFTPPGTPADLIGGASPVSSTATLLAPFPDVILLLQSEVERTRDAFGFADDAGGVIAFREELGATLLLSVYWGGRGAAVEGVLPPGVAPARPLPIQSKNLLAAKLSLASPGVDAPHVAVRFAFDDELLRGVGDRLTVQLRSRGFLTDARPMRGGPLLSGMELMRWRPSSRDPALALLELAGRNVELQSEEVGEGTLDPRLLSGVVEERLEAALALERRWIEEYRVVPLMTAERWFSVDPRLRNVHIRADGVPLFHDAFWGAAP